MSEPMSVTSCGDCFESWADDGGAPLVDEVEIHTEETDHRYDVKFEDVE